MNGSSVVLVADFIVFLWGSLIYLEITEMVCLPFGSFYRRVYSLDWIFTQIPGSMCGCGSR